MIQNISIEELQKREQELRAEAISAWEMSKLAERTWYEKTAKADALKETLEILGVQKEDK